VGIKSDQGEFLCLMLPSSKTKILANFTRPSTLRSTGLGLEAFKWLVLGHIVYAIGLALAFSLEIPNGVIWMTPLFAAPLVWKGRGHRLWAKVLALIVGVTAAHYLGMQAAAYAQQYQATLSAVPEPSLLPGFAGGAVGADRVRWGCARCSGWCGPVRRHGSSRCSVSCCSR
jgi:hypothetical protein